MPRLLIIALLLVVSARAGAQAPHGPQYTEEYLKGLWAAIHNDDPATREKTVYEIGNLKEPPGEAYGIFLNLISTDANPDVRIAAIRMIRKFGRFDTEGVQILLTAVKDANPHIRATALNMLSLIKLADDSLIPVFTGSLTDDAPSVRREAVLALARYFQNPPADTIQPLTAALNDEDAGVRFEAAYTLTRLKSFPPEGVQALIAALDNPLTRIKAVYGLLAYGPAAAAAVPHLLEILRDIPEGPTLREVLQGRENNTDIIALLKEKKPKSILLKVLEAKKPDWHNLPTYPDKNTNMLTLGWKNGYTEHLWMEEYRDECGRAATALALGCISSDREVIDALIERLDDIDPNVQGRSASALGRIGEKAADAIPLMIEKLAKPASYDLREGIYSALKYYGPLAGDAVPALISRFKSEDYHAKENVLKALVAIGPAAVEAIPDIYAVLDEHRPKDESYTSIGFNHIAESLAEIAKYTDDYKGYLLNMQTHPDPSTRFAALTALGRLGESAVPDIVKSFDDTCVAVRQHAVETLAAMDETSVPVAMALGQALSDAELPVRDRAAIALTDRGSIAKDTAPALIKALQSTDTHGPGPNSSGKYENIFKRYDFAEHCMNAIGKIGPDAADAVPILTEFLTHERIPLRKPALYALAGIGPAASPAVPKIIDALRLRQPEIRLVAAYALGQIGPAARDAVPGLIGLLDDTEPEVRYNGVVALGKIGPDASQALPVLTQIAKGDANSEVRNAAREAILLIAAS